MGAYSPYDNANLSFPIYSSFSVDPNTGNRVQNTTNETYSCSVQLKNKFTENKEGINEIETRCFGKLLEPSVFSDKIKVGMVADATINGVPGKLRLLDLGSNTLVFARASQFQDFTAVFEQTGAAS
tara:strand:- start:647 stop:1024 length:378 start_codon:yes stop_codon:yes gene_type:complete